MLNILDLPVEIRIEVYPYLFMNGKVLLDAGACHGPSYLIPEHAVVAHHVLQSSQILRTCKTILYEARPLLYKKPIFHVLVNIFAGNLPVAVSNGSSTASQGRTSSGSDNAS